MVAPPDVVAVTSRHLTILPLRGDQVLCVHALRMERLLVTADVVGILREFEQPRSVAEWARAWATDAGDPDSESSTFDAVLGLVRSGLLWDTAAGDETEHYRREYGADVASVEAATRRLRAARNREFGVAVPRDLSSFTTLPRLSVLFYGSCNVQLGMDLFRAMGREAGLDCDVAATFFDDLDLPSERKPDVVVIGHLPTRHALFGHLGPAADAPPNQLYVDQLRTFIADLRVRTAAPLLVLDFPVPTCTPLGLADRGPSSHRNRVRQLNLSIAALALEHPDVFVVDLDAAWGAHGRDRLVDDGMLYFSHLGSLSWLVHTARIGGPTLGRPLPVEELERALQLEPFEPERLLARALLDIVLPLRGVGMRKCVVVDLDDTLWPGVLAETGVPFPDGLSWDWPTGYYLGIHQALKALQRRGILLACASKNDESVVQAAWRYPPWERPEDLVHLADFVTSRIGWGEKVDALVDIARELNIGIDSLVFVDDNPVEREKVRAHLPSVLVLGDEPYGVRRALLTHAGLQVPRVTPEGQARNAQMRAQIERDRQRIAARDPAEFLASLAIRCTVARVRTAEDLDRMHELVLRTNQFNTTTRRWSREELEHAVAGRDRLRAYSLRVSDRLVSYGIVGVAVVRGSVIESFVLSCRVIGLEVERVFLEALLADLAGEEAWAEGLFLPTDKNAPARDLFRKNGFVAVEDGRWRRELVRGSGPTFPATHTVELDGISVAARD